MEPISPIRSFWITEVTAKDLVTSVKLKFRSHEFIGNYGSTGKNLDYFRKIRA